MGNIALVDELLGVPVQTTQRGIADFAASIAASNGMLIPLELLVQTRLSDSVSLDDAHLLQSEFRHKSRLLDADRRIVVCVCDIVSSDLPPSPANSLALATCVAALAPAHIPRVLAVAPNISQYAIATLLDTCHPAELVVRIELDGSALRPAPRLRELLAPHQAQPRTRVLAVLAEAGDGGTPAALSSVCVLLDELAAEVDVIFLLSMLTCGKRPPAPEGRARYLACVNHLESLGLVRLAPGLYAPQHRSVPRRALPWLTRIMGGLPHADVLGLGPAARSRFNEMHFDNHSELGAYARDVKRGGYGIARTSTSSPLERFTEALLIKLASGNAVDVAALAARCQCATPLFMQACDRIFDGLRSSGAISGRDTQRVKLEAANDAWFPELHAELRRLHDSTSIVTPLARR